MERNKGYDRAGLCSNIHSMKRYCRHGTEQSLLPGNDVVFLWPQLLEEIFSFRRINKLHSSDLKVLGTDWVSQKPSPVSQMQPEKLEYRLSSRTHISIPILYVYKYVCI